MDNLYSSFSSPKYAAIEIVHSLIQAGTLGRLDDFPSAKAYANHIATLAEEIEAALRERYPSQAGSVSFSM